MSRGPIVDRKAFGFAPTVDRKAFGFAHARTSGAA
jgi:hypothetical protein